MKLSSAGFLEGLQRGKPTVDLGSSSATHEGVIALTGCLASRFCQRLLEDRDDDARAHARELLGIFGEDNVYFEVQKNGLAAQDKCNEGIVRIAKELGGSLVGTGDVHYLRREDYDHHTALLCVQTKSTIAGPEAALRDERVLPARQRGDGGGLRGVAGGDRQHRRDRRALRGGARARQAADPQLRDARTARSERDYLRARVTEGLRAALRRPAAGGGAGADGHASST